MSILEIRDLEVVYRGRDGTPVRAVAGTSLSVDVGEIVGLVGETGCGKSSLARAAVGLEPAASGEVIFDGQRVQVLGRRARTKRDARLQMVFQNPYGSLNPRRTIGDQVADGLLILNENPRGQKRPRVAELLRLVGLSADVAQRHPHQLSGGQRQRVAIARALAADPRLIVLDEPLSALDASVQAQVANLLVELSRELGVGMLLISHDLAIVRHVAHRVAVMYLGQVVETAATRELWDAPMHPYTRALIDAIPHPDGLGRLPEALTGEIPDPARPPTGCRFHPRCRFAFDRCPVEVPLLTEIIAGRSVACWLHDPATLPTPLPERSEAAV
jgi:peptide/nickel transport system ATP-binding protein